MLLALWSVGCGLYIGWQKNYLAIAQNRFALTIPQTTQYLVSAISQMILWQKGLTQSGICMFVSRTLTLISDSKTMLMGIKCSSEQPLFPKLASAIRLGKCGWNDMKQHRNEVPWLQSPIWLLLAHLATHDDNLSIWDYTSIILYIFAVWKLVSHDHYSG